MHTLRKRFDNGELVMYKNYENGDYINLIKINEPYADGVMWGVYVKSESIKLMGGEYKTEKDAINSFYIAETTILYSLYKNN